MEIFGVETFTLVGYYFWVLFLERSVILSKDSWLQSTSIECVYSMNGLLWVAINELYLLAGEMTCDVAVTERASLAEVAVMRRGSVPGLPAVRHHWRTPHHRPQPSLNAPTPELKTILLGNPFLANPA